MVKKEKTNLYLLSIVSIVAVIGIVVMILNSASATHSTSWGEENLAGQVYKKKPVQKETNSDEGTATTTDDYYTYTADGQKVVVFDSGEVWVYSADGSTGKAYDKNGKFLGNLHIGK